jgi:hypothetical protein
MRRTIVASKVFIARYWQLALGGVALNYLPKWAIGLFFVVNATIIEIGKTVGEPTDARSI